MRTSLFGRDPAIDFILTFAHYLKVYYQFEDLVEAPRSKMSLICVVFGVHLTLGLKRSFLPSFGIGVKLKVRLHRTQLR